MKTIAMRISPGCGTVGGELAPGLITLMAIAGMGYVFWGLLVVVQTWAASAPWAAQFIQWPNV
jgi:hypothetical protein